MIERTCPAGVRVVTYGAKALEEGGRAVLGAMLQFPANSLSNLVVLHLELWGFDYSKEKSEDALAELGVIVGPTARLRSLVVGCCPSVEAALPLIWSSASSLERLELHIGTFEWDGSLDLMEWIWDDLDKELVPVTLDLLPRLPKLTVLVVSCYGKGVRAEMAEGLVRLLEGVDDLSQLTEIQFRDVQIFGDRVVMLKLVNLIDKMTGIANLTIPTSFIPRSFEDFIDMRKNLSPHIIIAYLCPYLIELFTVYHNHEPPSTAEETFAHEFHVFFSKEEIEQQWARMSDEDKQVWEDIQHRQFLEGRKSGPDFEEELDVGHDEDSGEALDG